MGCDPKDVSSLEKALNDAASKASVLWTTFITFEIYFAIAFGSVTHRDMLLDKPIKLPVLNVDLPLVGFFVVAPAVLAIFHFYVFLQLLALARKAKDYDVLMREVAPVAADRQYLRQRLDSFLILQFIAGPREQRTGSSGLWLRLIAWITLVGAPVAILLQAQVTFLPYHQTWVLWLQRGTILFSLVVVWYYWIRIRKTDQPIVSLVSETIWKCLGWVTTAFVAVFCVLVATFPGEWVDEAFPEVSLVPVAWPFAWARKEDWTSFHELLFAGDINEVSSRPVSLFSDRLIVADQSIVDSERVDRLEVTISLRGRDLRRAVLSRTDLRKAD
jgi:hypothetical protein